MSKQRYFFLNLRSFFSYTIVNGLCFHENLMLERPLLFRAMTCLKQLRRIITVDSIREKFSLWTDSAEK